MLVLWVVAVALIVCVLILACIAFVLIEARLTVGTRVVVMERDLRWITAALQKWGIVPPKIDRE